MPLMSILYSELTMLRASIEPFHTCLPEIVSIEAVMRLALLKPIAAGTTRKQPFLLTLK
jgi:hypothetical protein